MIRIQIDVVGKELTVAGTPTTKAEALGHIVMALFSVLTTDTANGLDAKLVEEPTPLPEVDLSSSGDPA